jgi:predicted DNA-binding transcriptional regulator YafY
MSVNKLALIRYKTIDECLRNKFKKWTLEDLIEKVAEAVYEYEGVAGVSKRTIQADIQLMRSDKLGYNAPIVVIDKKYYAYEDPKFSIAKTPINPADVEKLKEIVGVLKGFAGFDYFSEMTEVVAKLENNLYKSSRKTKNHIQFESNKLLKGIAHINPLYQFIIQKKALLLDYQSFKAKKPQQLIVFPYLLKEYRNRWFLIAQAKYNHTLMTFALDRMVGYQHLPEEPFLEAENIDFDTYYNDLIGVTKTKADKVANVVLHIDKLAAPYVLTKPFHASQTLLKEDENGIIISLKVILNFELEREILGFGEAMKVLTPRILANRIRKRLESAVALYQEK